MSGYFKMDLIDQIFNLVDYQIWKLDLEFVEMKLRFSRNRLVVVLEYLNYLLVKFVVFMMRRFLFVSFVIMWFFFFIEGDDKEKVYEKKKSNNIKKKVFVKVCK